jgi:hypothetical protein
MATRATAKCQDLDIPWPLCCFVVFTMYAYDCSANSSFEKASAAQNAVNKLHKTTLAGYVITVSFERPRASASKPEKASLMRKLMREDDRLPSEEPPDVVKADGSRCVLLKNLFDPNE